MIRHRKINENDKIYTTNENINNEHNEYNEYNEHTNS